MVGVGTGVGAGGVGRSWVGVGVRVTGGDVAGRSWSGGSGRRRGVVAATAVTGALVPACAGALGGGADGTALRASDAVAAAGIPSGSRAAGPAPPAGVPAVCGYGGAPAAGVPGEVPLVRARYPPPAPAATTRPNAETTTIRRGATT
ncbi:hypothetical protein KRMM14A1259_63910 [Krasilnikovia sp. MM14-A1259]